MKTVNVFAKEMDIHCGSHHYELITGSQHTSQSERKGEACFI